MTISAARAETGKVKSEYADAETEVATVNAWNHKLSEQHQELRDSLVLEQVKYTNLRGSIETNPGNSGEIMVIKQLLSKAESDRDQAISEKEQFVQ